MRRKRSYKFTDKKQSKGGIRATLAGTVSLVCTGIMTFLSYESKGNTERYVVLFGVAAIACCAYGTVCGSRSFKEEECYYLFSRIGTGINLLLLIFWIAVLGMGILL